MTLAALILFLIFQAVAGFLFSFLPLLDPILFGTGFEWFLVLVYTSIDLPIIQPFFAGCHCWLVQQCSGGGECCHSDST